MKVCSRKTKCIHTDGPELELSEFGLLISSKDGLQYRCKVCSREIIKQFKLKNKDKVSQEGKKYRLKNKDRISEYGKRYRKDNKEKELHRFKKYREANPEKVKRSKSDYVARNKDKIAESNKRYALDNPEKVAMAKKKYSDNNRNKLSQKNKEYRQKNPGKMAAESAKRRAAKTNRTPQWANLKKIEQLYWVSKTLTERTGIKWVVDHKVPLMGTNVSGLHVEDNLQVITESRNLTKSNKFTPVMGVI